MSLRSRIAKASSQIEEAFFFFKQDHYGWYLLTIFLFGFFSGYLLGISVYDLIHLLWD